MKSKLPIVAVALFFTCRGVSVFAHDTWLIPDRFRISPGEPVTFDITSGMEFPKLDVGPKRERIQAVVCRLAGRTVDLNDFEAGPNSLRIKGVLSNPGIAAIWVKSPPREIELKAEEVQHYLDEIDAPATLRKQWADTKEPKRWRESYSKRSKTFVRVGDKADTSWSEPVGLFLEIVPEKDPTTLKAGEDFPVRVLKDGKPFADFSLGIVAEGETKGSIKKTDAAGKVSFRLDKSGRWLLRGTDVRKSAKQDIDWESDFTTLTVQVATQND